MYIHVRIYRMSPNYCHVYNLKRNEIISTSNNLPSFNQNIRAYFSSKTSRIIPIRGYLRGQKTKHSSPKLRKRYLKLSQGSIRKLSHTLYIPCRKYLRILSAPYIKPWPRLIGDKAGRPSIASRLIKDDPTRGGENRVCCTSAGRKESQQTISRLLLVKQSRWIKSSWRKILSIYRYIEASNWNTFDVVSTDYSNSGRIRNRLEGGGHRIN